MAPSPVGLSGQGLSRPVQPALPGDACRAPGRSCRKASAPLGADSTPQHRRLLGEHMEPRGHCHGLTVATLALSWPPPHRDGAPPCSAWLSLVQETRSVGTGTLPSLQKA